MTSEFLSLALATSGNALVIAKAPWFDPIRNWLKARSDLLGELASCHFCLGTWIALILNAIYQVRLVQSWLWLDVFVSAMAIFAVAAFISNTILLLARLYNWLVAE